MQRGGAGGSKRAYTGQSTRARARASFLRPLERHRGHKVGLVDSAAREPFGVTRTKREAQSVSERHVEPELPAHARLELRAHRILERAPVVDEARAADSLQEKGQGGSAAIDVDDREPVFAVEERIVLASFVG